MSATDENNTGSKGASHDVFLSYNLEDRGEIEKVAVYLEDQAGLKPWFDFWLDIPGESHLKNLYRGLEASSSCAVFVGQSGEGPWEKQDVREALQALVERKNYRIIPVLLQEAATRPQLPHFLFNTTWVDMRNGLDNEDALWHLECGIKGVAPGRGRPQQPTSQQPRQPASTVTIPYVEVQKATHPKSVFVSYRHQEPDQSVAHALAGALRQAGHDVFIDTGIRWGANWVKEINHYLEKADYFLLLLSKGSAVSEMVVTELGIARELALKKGYPVILPLRLSLPFDAPLPYHVSAYLNSIQQAQWSRPDDTTHVIKRLLDVLAQKARWAATGEAIDSAASAPKIETPHPQIDPRDMIVPGGALGVNSRFYIARQADQEVYDHVTRDRGIVTVRGPRQTGKTSLMKNTKAALHVGGGELRTAFIDFQSFSSDDLNSLPAVWHSIANHVARRLKLDGWDPECWKPGMDHTDGLPRFLERCVFATDERPILICLDEIDRVFRFPIKDGFFSTLRSFYNEGADDPYWHRVRWLLGTSSEPRFFIEDLTQSPFDNITPKVHLDAFTRAETEAFARRHGLELDVSTLDRVMDYLGGRPYLVHLFFYNLVRQPDSAERLFDAHTAGGGVFRDHLHSYLMQFQREPALAAAMWRVAHGEFGAGVGFRRSGWLGRLMRHITWGQGHDKLRLADRLQAAGLARSNAEKRLVPQCGLYAEFFGKELSANG